MDEDDIESSPQASEDRRKPEKLQLHPDGDAVLLVHDPRSDAPRGFVVSSAILSVASQYFRTLLRSEFKEGIETRRGDCPNILLGEDDPDAMETILSLLHYRNLGDYDVLEPKELATVALHSDKYDCTRALRPWISQWLGSIRDTPSAEDRGFLLVAAYFFRASDHFENISASAVRLVTVDDVSMWASHGIMNLLPHEIRGAGTRYTTFAGANAD
jgi:BTB/POZ domain